MGVKKDHRQGRHYYEVENIYHQSGNGKLHLSSGQVLPEKQREELHHRVGRRHYGQGKEYPEPQDILGDTCHFQHQVEPHGSPGDDHPYPEPALAVVLFQYPEHQSHGKPQKNSLGNVGPVHRSPPFIGAE